MLNIDSRHRSSFFVAKALVVLVLCSYTFIQCKKKEPSLDVSAIVCKNMKLSSPWYRLQNPSPCTDSIANGRVLITSKYEGNADCLKKINIRAEFYDVHNVRIPNIAYTSVISFTDGLAYISRDSLKFTLNYTYPSGVDSRTTNFIYVNYNAGNETGEASNSLQLQVYSDCAILDTSTYDVVKTVKVTSGVLGVTVWDKVKEDGDVISVWLNDVLVLDNVELFNAKRTFYFPLNPGSNKLVVFAITEGGEGANTAGISINNGSDFNLKPSLLTGKAIDIVYTPPPVTAE